MSDIKSYINSRKKYIINLAKELIEIPTVNPPGLNYEKIVGRLKKETKRLGLATRVYEVPKSFLTANKVSYGSKRLCLVADWNTNCAKTLHINGHYDVVPAGSNWKTPPFTAIYKDGKIFGRGAEDMKGQIAGYLLAIEALKKLNYKPRVNIQLSFVPDEEIGGATGFGWLVKRALIKASYGISEGYSDNYISNGNKGILWADVVVRGRASHASRPRLGINAFEKMLEVAQAFKKLKQKVERRSTKFGVRNPQDKFATMVLGGELFGGDKINVVPDMANFTIDRRILPEEDTRDVKKEILEAINKLKKKDKELAAKLSVRTETPAVAVDKNEPICRAMSSAVEKIIGKPAKFALMPGGTDTRFLIRKGIPCVGYSARGGESWHSDNEFVYVDSLVDTACIIALTIMNL